MVVVSAEQGSPSIKSQNDARRAELLTGAQARELEPMLTPECRGAVHLPDEGLIDPVRLTCGYSSP